MSVIATIDDRFESYNVEMAEVIGGKFWKPYDAATLASLTAKAAAAKTGNSAPLVGSPPAQAPAGFQGVLTRPQWKGVIDFAQAVNAELVSSFAISAGVRNAEGVWTPVQAWPFLQYTRSVGGKVAAAELFNEPSMPSAGGAPPGYDANSYAKDIAAFRLFAKATVPEMAIVGPGSVGEGGVMSSVMPLLSTRKMLEAGPAPIFDIYSYHSYAAASIRCASLGALRANDRRCGVVGANGWHVQTPFMRITSTFVIASNPGKRYGSLRRPMLPAVGILGRQQS